MHPLPVAQRELLVAARRPKTYRARVMVAGATLIFTAYFAWVFTHIAGGVGFGRQMFTFLSQFGFLYCLFAGAGNTADCLSSEKREGTIGFLFLTRLRSYDIVLGKLLATSLHAVYGLGATVPVFALGLLMGGVQAGEFGRTILALFNTLFFSLAIGLLVSSVARQERRATQTTAGVMVFFGFFLPLLGEYLRRKTNAIELGWCLRVISPAQMLEASTVPTAGVRYFWWSLATVHAFAWLALVLACGILRVSWQDEAKAASCWRERLQRWSSPPPERRTKTRIRQLEINPFYWLAARYRLVELEAWTTVIVVVALAGWAAWFFRVVVPVFVISMIVVVTLHSMIKMQVAASACDRLADEKHQGTLEMILATPFRVPQLIRGLWLALFRRLAGPFLSVVAITFALLIVVLVWRAPDVLQDAEAVGNCVAAVLAAVIMLGLDVFALAWTGMWQGVAARQAMQARSRTLSCILFLPWALLVLLTTLTGIAGATGTIPWMRELQFKHFLGTWFILGLVNDLAWAFWARHCLLTRFRVMATERFAGVNAEPTWWEALGRAVALRRAQVSRRQCLD